MPKVLRPIFKIMFFEKRALNLSINDNQKWQPAKLVTNHITKSK